jgi:hypothetical protein
MNWLPDYRIFFYIFQFLCFLIITAVIGGLWNIIATIISFLLVSFVIWDWYKAKKK